MLETDTGHHPLLDDRQALGYTHLTVACVIARGVSHCQVDITVRTFGLSRLEKQFGDVTQRHGLVGGRADVAHGRFDIIMECRLIVRREAVEIGECAGYHRAVVDGGLCGGERRPAALDTTRVVAFAQVAHGACVPIHRCV